MKSKMYQNSSKCSKGKIFFTLTLVAALMFAGCNKDDDGGASALIGEWTSVSATGSVTYFNTALTSIVNSKLTTYDLTGVATLGFDKSGKLMYSGKVSFPVIYDYTLNGDKLTFSANEGREQDLYKVEVNGDEFTLTHYGVFVGDVLAHIAWYLGDMELKANTMSGSVNVTAANLTIKLKKTKK